MLYAWLSLWVRAGIILAGSALLARFSPKSTSAASRHRILSFGFALLFVWPVLSAAVPELILPLPSASGRYLVTVTQTTRLFGAPGESHSSWHWLLIVWLTGVAFSLALLAIGAFRVSRLARRAILLEDACWTTLLEQECARARVRRVPRLLMHPEPLTALTFGILSPTIILPSECLAWAPERCRIVLMHELAHIRRGDLFWQVFAHSVAAIWWFQPLCWLNLRLLRHESEQACDAQVVQSGIRASDYAHELLYLARELQRSKMLQPAAFTMTQPSGFEKRIHAVLNANLTRGGKLPALSLGLLAMLACSVSAITLSPGQDDFDGGHPMKKTLISGLLASAGLLATSNGAALVPSRPDSHQSETQQPKPVRVTGEMEQEKLIHKVNPVYPTSAKKAGVQGVVLLDVTISKDGVPEDIQVLQSPSDDLAQSAEEAVRQWRYRTTLLNGQPVPVIAEVKVSYTLAR